MYAHLSIVYVTYAIDKCAHVRETERSLCIRGNDIMVFVDIMVAFSRLNCCRADPWALAAIGWSRRIYQ